MIKKSVLICAALLMIFANASYARAIHVRGSFTKSGTYRQPHMRTSPNKTKFDNWSSRGNVNPYTGKVGTKNLYK